MRSSSFSLVVVVLVGLAIAEVAAMSQTEEDVPPTNTMHCSDGWRTTGYFTPIETDYNSGEATEIEVGRLGKMSFDSEFIRTVFDPDKGFGEGWGKTRFGWYLGNYSGGWHKADTPLGASNNPLKPNSLAVDNSLIPNNSMVTIPGLPGSLGETKFVADDVGVGINGKHVDIYTGEGKDARRLMYDITYEDDDDLQRVCFDAPAQPK
jgi:3D (Asp-Asp-Asp) domain-containing protein